MNLMRKAGPKVDKTAAAAAVDGGAAAAAAAGDLVDPEEEFDFMEQLLQSRELNALVKAHNVILFCNQVLPKQHPKSLIIIYFFQNQEQCPCVSNCCEIASEVMEDVRPFALMIEECRELYAILTTPHIRVKQNNFP